MRQTLLGQVLMGTQERDVLTDLRFTDGRAEKVRQAILAADTVDIVSVAETLYARDDLDAVGGVLYLSMLLDEVAP